MRRSWLAAVCAAVLALGSACGSDSEGGDGGSGGGAPTSTSPADSRPVEVGSPITVTQPDAESTVTVKTQQWETSGQDETASEPKSGTYLVIDVVWSGDGPYNSMYFSFRAESGEEYDSEIASLAGFEPTLDSGELAGGKVRGYVIFDAPRTAGVVLVTNQILDHAGSWSIDA